MNTDPIVSCNAIGHNLLSFSRSVTVSNRFVHSNYRTIMHTNYYSVHIYMTDPKDVTLLMANMPTVATLLSVLMHMFTHTSYVIVHTHTCMTVYIALCVQARPTDSMIMESATYVYLVWVSAWNYVVASTCCSG